MSAQVCRKVQQALQQQPTIGQVQEEEGQRVVALLLLLPTFFVADLLAKVDQHQAQDQHQLTLCRLQLRLRRETVAARQPRAHYT